MTPVIIPAHKYHYVIYRFKRARDIPPSQPSSSQHASTTKRAEKSCDIAFQLLEFEDHVEFRQISDHSLIHSHSLDESDPNKRNSFIRALAGKDIAKGYPAAAMIGSLRGIRNSATQSRLASAGGEYLTRQDMMNSTRSWHLADPNALYVSHESKDNVTLQVLEAFEKLNELKWVWSSVQAISLDKTPGRGIVFALPTRLECLAQYGHFSLIDSTHKTNQLEWKLFMLMVRDKYTSWHPVAHALLSHEFGELIAEFLLVVKNWANWKPRYVLSDDSGAEQRTFRLAFPGLVAGETEVSENLIFF